MTDYSAVRERRWIALALLCVAQFMVVLDASIFNRALRIWGAVAGSGGAAGVLLGGVLTSGLGWEWVLWVNVPIGLIAAAIAPRLMAESRSEQRRQFDVTSVSRAQMRLGQLPADQPASA